jgi:hypothetical protein
LFDARASRVPVAANQALSNSVPELTTPASRWLWRRSEVGLPCFLACLSLVRDCVRLARLMNREMTFSS